MTTTARDIASAAFSAVDAADAAFGEALASGAAARIAAARRASDEAERNLSAALEALPQLPLSEQIFGISLD